MMDVDVEIEYDDPRQLARELRQRLEALKRAGLNGLRMPEQIESFRVASPQVERPAKVEKIEIKPANVSIPSVTEPKRIPTPTPPSAPATNIPMFGETGFDEPPLPVEQRIERLAALKAEVQGCQRCPILVANRTQTVFGIGHPAARLLFVGEAPGADEDRTGEPFVGKAGHLLNDMIEKGMGLTRAEVYIANAVKSRPPDNRTPLSDEVKNCLPFLEREIEIVRPEFLCLLGKTAVTAILATALPMSKLRGRWHRYRGIPTVVTWHPAYLLRTPSAKRETWDDLRLLMNGMGLKMPDRPQK